ncbi:hypothetical protein HY214_01120 [Candidatus Roizmanbacteria bacterium]|nr:hypothetical protein [Candidatus Roizmanbacteria bacterium]
MKKIIALLFFLSVFFLSFRPARDPDFGWHYRCGKEIFTKHTFCLKNKFSYHLTNYSSASPSFLYDGLLAFTYDRFGFLGVSAVGAFIIALCGLAFIRITRGALLLRLLTFYLIYFGSDVVFGLGLRSQLLTYFFFLINILILQSSRRKPRLVWFFPPLFLAWVNTHIGFFIGPIVFLVFILEQLFNKKPVRLYMFVFVIGILATFLNPFGLRVYKEIANHLFSPLGSMIAEWVPPPFILQAVMGGIWLGSLFLFVKTKRLSIFYGVLSFFFLILAFNARRNIPFFLTTIAFYLLVLLENRQFLFQLVEDITLPLLMTILIMAVVIRVPPTVVYSRSWQAYCSTLGNNFPCRALARNPQLAGNVFATYEWGGFLIWQKPDIKVFVDGRMPAWKETNGQSPYATYLAIIQTQPGWNEILLQSKTDYLLILPGTFLDILLKQEGKKYAWKKIDEDETSVIYQHRY